MKIGDVYQSKFLKCDDLEGQSLPVVIERWEITTFKEDNGTNKQQPVLFFQGIDKGLGCNITNCRSIEQITGSDDFDDWIGRELLLVPSVTTRRDGSPTPCVRIMAPPKRKAVNPVARTAQTNPKAMASHPLPGDRGKDEPPPHMDDEFTF